MPGKSLDQVWQQMRAQAQAQRQAEVQRQLSQERAINEQRERSRLEYLQRMKMNERLAPTAAAASAAAGAGGSGNRQQEVITFETNQSVLYYWHDSGVFEYFIYNFEADSLTDIKSIAAPGFVLSVNAVQNGGFLVWIQGGGTNQFYFLDLAGDVVWTDTNAASDHVDVENFSRYVAPYYEQGPVYKLVVFSSTDIREFTFDNYIEGGGYSYDDVSSFGFIVREDLESTQKYYMIKDGESEPLFFKEAPTGTTNIYQYAFSDKVVSHNNSQEFVVYGSDGAVLSSFDYADALDGTYYINELSMLSADGSFLCMLTESGGSRLLLFFSGTSNSFSWKSLDSNYNYRIDLYDQKDYNNPSNFHAEGAAAVLFHDNSDDRYWNGIYYYSDAKFLPIWSTDSELRDFFTYSYETGFQLPDDSIISPMRSAEHIGVLVDATYNTVFLFSDAGTFSSISTGGQDGDENELYNIGNILSADGLQVDYTHTQLQIGNTQLLELTDFPKDGTVQMGVSPSLFGLTSSYCTNMYPGVFLLAAHDIDIDTFGVTGSLNSNPDRDVDTLSVQIEAYSQTYQVFAKRVFGSHLPALNHIIIVNAATASGITQSIGSTTSDYHELQGLSSAGVTRIYYLAIPTKFGVKLTNEEVEDVATGFINVVTNPTADLEDVLTNMDSLLTFPDETYKILRYNRTGETTTLLPTTVSKTNNIDNDDLIDGRFVLQFRKDYEQTDGSFGWDDLSDYETRRYSGFHDIFSGSNGAGVLSQLFVMKDTTNDKYWAIDFTQWTGGGGGGFAYTRRLIEDGYLTGPTISFTHSNYGEEVDVIEPGVLEITREEYGPLYNIAKESESNGENPYGTLWNAEGVYTWTEFTHVMFDIQGNQVDSVVTEDYTNYWDGSTYLLRDDINNNTYVSNDADNDFTQLGSYYEQVGETSGYINETLINDGILVLFHFPRFRLITRQTVFDEVVVDASGIGAKKLSGSLTIFSDGFTFAREDVNGTTWFFYNLSSVLVGTLQVPSGRSSDSISYSGKRLTVQWESEEGKQNYTLFNGTTIREFTTQWPYDSTGEKANDNLD